MSSLFSSWKLFLNSSWDLFSHTCVSSSFLVLLWSVLASLSAHQLNLDFSSSQDNFNSIVPLAKASLFSQDHLFFPLFFCFRAWSTWQDCQEKYQQPQTWWWYHSNYRKWRGTKEPLQFSSVQSLSCVWFFAIPWTVALQASVSITNSQSLLKLTSIKLVMSSNPLILCCPLLLLPSIFPSIRGFSSESVLHIRKPKFWSFSFSISPYNEYSGLISFRIDWLDLLAVQEILKSLLQCHSSL